MHNRPADQYGAKQLSGRGSWLKVTMVLDDIVNVCCRQWKQMLQQLLMPRLNRAAMAHLQQCATCKESRLCGILNSKPALGAVVLLDLQVTQGTIPGHPQAPACTVPRRQSAPLSL